MGIGPAKRKAKTRPPSGVSGKRRAASAAILLALLSLGLLIAGASLLLSRNEGSWWTVPLPALGAYALLLAGLFFKDLDNPIARLIGGGVEAVASRAWLAALLAVLTTAAAVALGHYLIVSADRPDGELRFIVYDRDNIEGRRQAGLTMELEHLLDPAPVVAQTTNDRGVAAFPISIGEAITVRLVRGDGRIYILYPNRTVSPADLATLTDVDISDVPSGAWLTRAAVDDLGEQVGSMRIEASLLRWQPRLSSRQVGDAAALAPFEPLALPRAEIVIAREPFITGFSPTLRQPRWVASRISGLPVGRRGRDLYGPDPLLPPEMQSSSRDYHANIFDRGHLVRRNDLGPSGSTDERNYMTGITPQTSVTNQRLWQSLENYTSALKRPSNEVLVLRGPAFVSTGSEPITISVIGVSRVPVPTHYFQVAMVVEGGRATYHCHLVPNTTQVGLVARGETPTRFRTTLPAIEAATGLRLFPRLSGAARPCQ